MGTRYGILLLVDLIPFIEIAMPTPNQTNSSKPADVKVEEGTWMKYDAAAIATGKSERTLKRYTKKGELKSRRLGNQVNSPIQIWITPDFIEKMGRISENSIEDPDIFDCDSEDAEVELDSRSADMSNGGLDDTPASASFKETRQPHSTDAYESMVRMMVSEFASQLDRKQDLLVELQRELELKESQLRLLPDLQKQLEEKQKDVHIQTVALEKQIAAISENLEAEKKVAEELRIENERLKTEAEAAKVKKGWFSWFVGQ